MAFSAKAFSLLRQRLNISIPSELPYDMPLWHNPIFHNKHFHSYACPALIRCSVLTVGQLLEDDSSLILIAPTWQAVYRDAIGQPATGMYEFDAQTTHPAVCFSTLLAEWHAGTAMATLSYPKEIERRQDASVWEAPGKSPLPDQDKDFVRVPSGVSFQLVCVSASGSPVTPSALLTTNMRL